MMTQGSVKKVAAAGLLLCLVVFFWGCSETPPPQPTKSPTKVVKIQDKSSPAAQNEKATGAQQQPGDADTAGTAPQKEQEAEAVSDLVQASLEIAATYDPSGRFDPFEPLFKDEPEPEEADTGKTKERKKRRPQTPLERVALSQLKLSAVIRAPSGNRALVEDATGKGYVVERGTYMGLNSGRVVQIERDKIVVEEEIESVLGELTLKNTELKLQKPAGEL